MMEPEVQKGFPLRVRNGKPGMDSERPKNGSSMTLHGNLGWLIAVYELQIIYSRPHKQHESRSVHCLQITMESRVTVLLSESVTSLDFLSTKLSKPRQVYPHSC